MAVLEKNRFLAFWGTHISKSKWRTSFLNYGWTSESQLSKHISQFDNIKDLVATEEMVQTDILDDNTSVMVDQGSIPWSSQTKRL